LGTNINTEAYDYCAVLPNVKFLFLSSSRSGNGDIYWIDAKIIEELRPKK